MTYDKFVRTYQAVRQSDNPERITLTKAKDESECFMSVLYAALITDNEVNFPGIGKLKLVKRTMPARKRFIPESGKMIEMGEHEAVKAYFKPSVNLLANM